MAVFDPGSSTLSAVTYEAALVEAISLYGRYLPSNSRAKPTFSITQNGAAITGVSSFPLEVAGGAGGSIVLSAINEIDVLENPTLWTSDPASDADASSFPAQILQIATKITEGTPLEGETLDRCTVSINVDAKIVQISFNFAMTVEDVDDPNVALAFSVGDYVADFA